VGVEIEIIWHLDSDRTACELPIQFTIDRLTEPDGP
jgi:hypothetical protein